MLSNRLVSLRRTLNNHKLLGKYLTSNSRNGSILKTNQWIRCVHSSNTHEIDFLFTKYKLSKISNGRQSYGQKSLLHHFNTIEDFNFETDKDLMADTLRRLLDIRKTDANDLIKNYPHLGETTADKVNHQITVLSDKFSLDVNHFLSCPWILYLPINFIIERLNPFGVKEIKKDYLVLLLVPIRSFESCLKKFKRNTLKTNIYDEFSQKLDLFTSELNIISEEFCDLFHENCFLFHYDFEKLKAVMDIVMSAGIEPETILSDLRIFTHNIDLMRKRIDICLEHKMAIKIWMLRSPEYQFNVSLRRHLENKKVLKNYENNIEYMANQLDCEPNVIQSLMKRYPRIVQISPKKLCQMLSFLLEKGYTTYHIVETPKILFHSVDTIEERIKHLKKINIKTNSLSVLTLSGKDYNKLLDQLKEINSLKS